MEINKENQQQRYQIQRYDPGVITINESDYHHSLIISADRLISPWQPKSLKNIDSSHWNTILQMQPEIVLLGTGEHFIMASDRLLAPLHEAKIGVECMDTAAACRHFIALSADNRKVTAALLIK